MSAIRHKWICGERGAAAGSVFAATVLAFCLTACSTMRVAPSSEPKDAKRIRFLERELNRTQRQLQDVRERNAVLEHKRRGSSPAAVHVAANTNAVPVPFQPSTEATLVPQPVASPLRAATGFKNASANRLPAVLPQKPIAQTPAAKLSGKKAKVQSVGTAQTGEHFLYSKILETYRKKNMPEMDQGLRLLLKTYPDSVFADNALYMAGLLAFESGDHERALKFMARVVRDYPRGNKAVSALLAKASIEKKKGLYQEARRTLHKIRQSYPGSPEANRVSVEMKLIDIEAGKRREI